MPSEADGSSPPSSADESSTSSRSIQQLWNGILQLKKDLTDSWRELVDSQKESANWGKSKKYEKE